MRYGTERNNDVTDDTEHAHQSGFQSDEGDHLSDNNSSPDGVGLTRRAALGGAALLGTGAAGYLAWGGLSGTAEDQPEEGEPGPSEQFAVWAEMQEVLKTSPDHLPARARGIVDSITDSNNTATTSSDTQSNNIGSQTASTESAGTTGTVGQLRTESAGGPEIFAPDHVAEGTDDTEPNDESHTDERTQLETLFAFVRDEIQTVPTTVDGVEDVDSKVRWGVRGTLRCGMGTPRDKAELLAALYRDAGFEAAVKVAEIDTDEYLTDDAVRAHLLDPPVRDGEPELDTEQLTDWAARIGREPSGEEPPVFDENGDESRALGQRLRQSLPEDITDSFRGPSAFDWRWNGSRHSSQPIPLVEVVDTQGNRHEANLFADVSFGQSVTGELEEPPELERPEPITVTLSAVTPDAIEEPFELVSGEWDVHELVGRQLRVRMTPTLELFDNPAAGLDEFDSFIPSIAVQDVHLDGQQQADLSEFGGLVTLQGDQYTTEGTIEDGVAVSGDDEILRNGLPLYDPTDEPPVDAIDSLDIDVRSQDYPRISVDVTALDATGEHVSGLGMDSFALTDNDARLAPTMRKLEPAPEIIYLIDVSGSMNRGVSAATDEEAYDELHELLADAAPGAIIDRREVDSDMWRHLPEAIADDPDLIVYAHDGLPANSYDDRVDPLLATAPPTVLLSARDETSPVEDEVVVHQAELAGATAVPMGEWQLLRDTLAEAAATVSDDSPTYKFTYGVPDRESGVRSVELAVGEKPADAPHASATGTYETDGTESGIIRSIVGLYLTIEHRDERATQTLGGYDPLTDEGWDSYRDEPDPDSGFGRPGLSALAEDTRMAMRGGVDISIEGDGVPFSIMMDDMLQAGQSYRGLDAVVRNLGLDDGGELTTEERSQLREEWETGRQNIQWDPFLVQSPLANAVNDEGLTYFLDPRIVSYQVKPVFDGNQATVEESLNVFVHSRAATATDDADDRFDRTLERTARISLLESGRFDESTVALIGDTPVAMIGELPDEVSTSPYRDLRRYNGFSSSRELQLAPVDGSVSAMWNIDRETGAAIGLLGDATGGAKRKRTVVLGQGGDVDRASAALSLYLDLLDSVNLIGGVGSVALGTVAAYYSELAKLYLKVTAVLGVLEETTGMDDIGGMAGGTAGGFVQNAARDLIPGGNWVGRFWDMAQIAGVP